MIRKFSFTENQEKEIIKNLNQLLKLHNETLKRDNIRILTKEDEAFLSGCKGNIVYGSQHKLSGKQLKRLSVIINNCQASCSKKEDSNQLKLKKIISNYG